MRLRPISKVATPDARPFHMNNLNCLLTGGRKKIKSRFSREKSMPSTAARDAFYLVSRLRIFANSRRRSRLDFG